MGRSATGLATSITLAAFDQDEIWTFSGIAINGATAGNIQHQFAQNAAQAVDTKVLKDSLIIATRIL